MATTNPPPPPPPPPPPLTSCGDQPRSISPPPCPGYAAIPFSTDIPPVQETSPSPEAIPDAQNAPLLPVQNGPSSPPSGGQEHSDSEDKYLPVQETEPAPQMTEQQDEDDQAGEEQLT